MTDDQAVHIAVGIFVLLLVVLVGRLVADMRERLRALKRLREVDREWSDADHRGDA